MGTEQVGVSKFLFKKLCTYKATVELEVSYVAAITNNALSVFPALLHAVFPGSFHLFFSPFSFL